MAAGCVLALMLAFPNAAVADAEPEDVSGDSALLLDNVDVLSSASISTLTPATIGKGERWTVPASGEMHPVVTIGVPDTADLGRERPMMISTIERLSRAMPGTQFRLRVILSAQKRMNKQGRMVVRHVNETIMEVFEVTGFVDILTIEE